MNKDLVFRNEVNKNQRGRYFFDEDIPVDFLPNVNTVNIFIGANNSGKSTFMRHMLEHQFNFTIENGIDLITSIKEHNKIIKDLKISILQNTRGYLPVESKKRFIPITEELPVIIISKDGIIGQIRVNENLANIILSFKLGLPTGYYTDDSKTFFLTPVIKGKVILLQKLSNKINNYLLSIKDVIFNNKSIFIPSLRTSHSFYKKNSITPTQENKLLSKKSNDDFLRVNEDFFSRYFREKS